MLFLDKIGKKEWVTVVGLSLFVMVLSLLPYIYAASLTPADHVYTGVRLNNAPDTFSYFAWIEQARQGKILFKELYTSEPQKPSLFQPVFLILGLVGKVTSLSNAVLYHTFRVITGVIFLIVGYIFLSKYFTQRADRLMVFGIFATASGLGWWFGYPSIDIIKMEANNFFMLYESLLDPVAMSLTLAIFLIFLYGKTESNKSLLWMIIFSNCLILVHPYDFVSLSAILFAYALIKYLSAKYLSDFRRFIYIILGSFPAIFIQVITLHHNQSLGVWAFFQTIVPALPIRYYLEGYGLIIPLALVGFIMLWKRGERPVFLVVWTIVSLFFLFSPIFRNFQQRLSLGLFIPLSVLGVVPIVWLIKQFKLYIKIPRGVSYLLIISLLALTNFYIIFGIDVPYSRAGQFPLYLTQKQNDTLTWIKNNVPDKSVILAGSQLSLAIPALAGRTVFYGHYDQTTNFTYKYSMAKQLFTSSTSNSTMFFLLASNKIDYIVVDNEVLSWAKNNFVPGSFLTEQYNNGEVRIYKVSLPPS